MSPEVSLPADKAELANQFLAAWDEGDMAAGHALLDLAEETGRDAILQLMAQKREPAPDRKQRVRILRIGLDLIRQLLGLPIDMHFEAVTEHVGFVHSQLVFRVSCSRFSEVIFGTTIPEMDVQYRLDPQDQSRAIVEVYSDENQKNLVVSRSVPGIIRATYS